MSERKLRIGFIPLADATALIVAVDKGFTKAEGLDIELVREVSWSNVRDKLNIGLFDAAHLLAPVAIASSLGLGHVKVPIITAIRPRTERQCDHGFACASRGDQGSGRRRYHRSDGDGARAVARCGDPESERRRPAHLRHDVSRSRRTIINCGSGWRPAASIPIRMSGWSCCRRPTWWKASPTAMSMPSVSARRGIRSRSISASATSCISFRKFCSARRRKCSRCASRWADENPDAFRRLVLAHGKAAAFVEDVENRDEVAAILAAPERIGVAPEVIRRTLDGRLKVSPDGTFRSSDRYLLVGRAQSRAARSGAGGVALCADGALGSGR